jgi:hypothetical protein
VKRNKKYRPRPVLRDPLGYVVEGMTLIPKYDQYMVDLNIKNHASMTNLTQGRADKADINRLISMANMAEALYRNGFGKEYAPVLRAGIDALYEVAKRGADSKKFVLRAAEMDAINTLLELHDAQLEIITVKDVDRALNLVHEELRNKRAKRIPEKRDGHSESTT